MAMFIDCFKSDKKRKCYEETNGVPCNHEIQKGEVYVLARAGAQSVSYCKKCFLKLAKRVENNTVWDAKTEQYETVTNNKIEVMTERLPIYADNYKHATLKESKGTIWKDGDNHYLQIGKGKIRYLKKEIYDDIVNGKGGQYNSNKYRCDIWIGKVYTKERLALLKKIKK